LIYYTLLGADGPTVQAMHGRDPERGMQVRQPGAPGRRRALGAVCARRGVSDAPEAQGADHRRDRGGHAERGSAVVVVVAVADAGRQGAQLGVGLHPEALGAAAAPARRPAVVAAAARPPGEVRGRAQSLDVRELPPPVSVSVSVSHSEKSLGFQHLFYHIQMVDSLVPCKTN